MADLENRMSSELWNFFRDQGSIISGLLALLAGIIAFGGARHAAKLQVKAIDQQTEAIRDQNDELKNETRRRQSQEKIVATTLLEGILARISADINQLNKLLDQPRYSQPNVLIPASWKRLIYAPPLSVVWNELGVCGRGVVEKYLELDAEIHEFASYNINSVDATKKSLRGA